ncbi:MAG: AmmeMemoRadiSam system protein A [Gammaproteobacteria bacterium]
MKLSDTEKCQLLLIAREAILHGVNCQQRRRVTAANYSAALQTRGASFITLTITGNLRGCVGSTESYRSLVEDVTHNAYSAAFEDSRFPPLSPEEYPALEVQTSILSPKEAVLFSSEDDLLGQLRPSIDGLLIEKSERSATFLPSVWASFPDPRQFLDQLKRKARIDDADPGSLKAWRYTTVSFSD